MVGNRRVLRPIRGGEQVVWSFSEASVGTRRYLFLLVDPRLAGPDEASKYLDDQLEQFGDELRDNAKVAHTRPHLAFDAHQEVAAKVWPAEAKEVYDRMAAAVHPFLLAISVDFREFDPRSDPWAVLWLPEAADPASHDELPEIFSKIARAVALGDDIFSYLHRLQEEREPSMEDRLPRMPRLGSDRVAIALPASVVTRGADTDANA